MKKILKNIIYFINMIRLNTLGKSTNIKSIIPLNLNVGRFVIIEKKCNIEKGILSIGDGTYIGSGTYINHCKSIGKYCSIAKGVGIGVGNHPIDRVYTTPLFYNSYRGIIDKTTYDFKIEDESVVIGNDVWIGYNAIILNGIKIGDGAIIAAGAVVNKDVEPYSIVGGVPAKHLKYRFNKEIINELIDKGIGNLSIENICKNIDDIGDVKEFIKKI